MYIHQDDPQRTSLPIADGLSKRMGLVHVDFTTLRRYIRASALWLANLFGLSSATSTEEAVTQVEALPVRDVSMLMGRPEWVWGG